jgi:hypothetical protein
MDTRTAKVSAHFEAGWQRLALKFREEVLRFASARSGESRDAGGNERRTRTAGTPPSHPLRFAHTGSNAEIDTPSPAGSPAGALPRLNMRPNLIAVFLTSFFAGGIPAVAEERVPAISEAALESLLAAVKPRAKESPWREIAWVTNITEARRRAVAEDKPLVIFTAADGSPLGRT